MSKIKEKELHELYGGSIPAGSEPSTTTYDDALAKAKRDQNYKAYLNTAIQQYALKNNTQKYLNNELASRGLNTQGYGTSAHASINNQAINLYSQNMADYNATEQQITEDSYARDEAKGTEKDNQLVTFINQANELGNKDAINKYMQNYGYMDQSGRYTKEWYALDDDRRAYIQSVIDLGNDTAEQSQNKYGSVFSYGDNETKHTAYDKKGNVVNSNHWDKEYKKFSNDLVLGNLPTNTFVKFENTYGETMYLYYGNDGNTYYVNKETWLANANESNSKTYKTTK